MRHILLLFLDGVGLGGIDPERNPFAQVNLPNLTALLNGRQLLNTTPRFSTERASFIPTDPCLGIAGLPQSATGQATIVTGLNIPQRIGKHWGPKPNGQIQAILRADNIFQQLVAQGHAVQLANAYPPGFFDRISSGQRSYSALQLAITTAGIPLYTVDDLRAGRAFSADFTGEGWQQQLQIPDTPLYTPDEAGRNLSCKAQEHSLLLLDHWPSDVIGHRGTMAEAVALLECFDAVLGGILATWNDAEGLIVITSDHGNLEDMSTRHHTLNRVPTLLIGQGQTCPRKLLHDLTHLTPMIREYLGDCGD